MLIMSTKVNAILPPLTSLFQQDDIANEIAPTSLRTIGNEDTPCVVPSDNQQVSQLLGDFVPEGEAQSNFQGNTEPERETPHTVSVQEGASHDSPIQVDHSPVRKPPGIIADS